MEPILVLDGLAKSYGAVRALDGLTLSLQPGPTGLLGPNGAGKTTLLKLCLGLLAPDAGSARIAGCDPRTASGRARLRRAVGYMPEGDCLVPGMSGVETVAMLGRLSGLAPRDAMTRAHEVLDYAGLDEARYREVAGWSTGMKQRLKLAQALVHDPPLLLLDEPTDGLDPAGRKHMLDLVHDLGHAQRKSLILCSHLLPDVEATCDAVVVISKGRAAASARLLDFVGAARPRVRVDFAGDAAAFARELGAAGIAHARAGESAFTLELAGAHADGAAGADGRDGRDGPDGFDGFVGAERAERAERTDGADADLALAAAARAGVRVLAVEPERATLEAAFLRALDEAGGHA